MLYRDHMVVINKYKQRRGLECGNLTLYPPMNTAISEIRVIYRMWDCKGQCGHLNLT